MNFQANLLDKTQHLNERLAAKKKTSEPKEAATPVLWKYQDPDSGEEFFLPVKKPTVKSPYSGKSFSAKPEKMQMSEVTKDLKAE